MRLAAELCLCIAAATAAPGNGEAFAALENDEALAFHDFGYWAFVDAHPAIAAAEEAYWDLSVLPRFRRIVAEFDEALNERPAAQALFDECHACLARHDRVREIDDALWRVWLEERELRGAKTEAFLYLRANPDAAIRFLGDPPRLHPVPESLYTLIPFLKRQPKVREELYACFQQLHEEPVAHTRVFPWWREASRSGNGVGAAYGRMACYFMGSPHHFWVWRRRTAALAPCPRERDWGRYLERCVRRDPVLSRTYAEYLRARRDRPGVRPAPAPSAWPPEGEPPVLPPMKRAPAQGPGRPMKEDLMPQGLVRPARPAKPALSMPGMPNRPARPSRPSETGKERRGDEAPR